jgi:hypothetical protein
MKLLILKLLRSMIKPQQIIDLKILNALFAAVTAKTAAFDEFFYFAKLVFLLNAAYE